MCQQKILKTGYFRQLARKSDGNFGKKRGSDSLFCLQRNANSELFWAEKQPSASSWAWKRTIILAKWFSNLGSVLKGLIVLARGYTKTIFALPNTCWESQTLELHPVDAGCAIASLIRSNSSQPYIIAHTPDQDVKCRSGHLHLRKQPLHDSFCTGHCSTLFISSW